MDVIRDIWELYGVRSDPFSTSPILVKGGNIPPDCFVGREDAIRRLGKIIGSSGGSRTLVFGETGVGKTTFVNIVRRQAVLNGYFSPFKEIAVQSDWSPADFIMNTLAAISASMRVMEQRPISDNTWNKLESLVELSFSDGSFGIDVAGFGGSFSRDRKSGRATNQQLMNFLSDLVQEIRQETGHDVIVHYNNLELLDERDIRRLFENLRDFFQTPNVHFVFVGNLSVKGYMQSITRFASTMTDTPIHIETLNLDEMKEILTRRFNTLQIPGLRHVLPYTPDCLEALFDLWGGNVRNILNSLSTAVQELTEEKPVLIDRNSLAVTLNSVLEKRYFSKLTPRQRDVLLEVVKREEITNKGLSEILKMPASQVSTNTKDLLEKGCIYVRRKSGRNKFWTADSILKWHLLKESDSSQKTLTHY